MQIKLFQFILFIMLVLGLVACATQKTAETEEITQNVVEQEIVERKPVVQSVVDQPEVLPAPTPPSREETLLKVKTFYFDYDKAELRQIAIDALNVHADNILSHLQNDPNMKVVVEGHADERGTIAYNNALGNRRAEAVARYLRVRGVPASNIDVISYGELRPILDDRNESAWQINRRSVLVY